MIPELLLAALVACNPLLTALFTPAHPQWGRYEVCTTGAPLETAMHDPAVGRLGPPHFGTVQLVDPLDAFGIAGPYDRSKLAQVYGGRRARLIRGWVERDGLFESTTLVSPYPDPTLSHLIEGTLLVRWVGSVG